MGLAARTPGGQAKHDSGVNPYQKDLLGPADLAFSRLSSNLYFL
jgi:hypothetical protein